jgi:DoxX
MNRATVAASALIQATLGIEFVLSGLDKFADPHYLADFNQFVRVNPGATSGLISGLVKTLVVPNTAIFAVAVQFAELTVGLMLLIGALERSWRGFVGRPGSDYRFQSATALMSTLAGLAVAGLTLSIALMMGESLPTVMSVNAFTTAIPVELLLVPFGIGVALIEAGRFIAIRRHSQTHGDWLMRRSA